MLYCFLTLEVLFFFVLTVALVPAAFEVDYLFNLFL